MSGTIVTYADLVEHALDYLGGEPDALALRDARRSAQSAYRDVANARTWAYLYQQGRLQTSAPYATGTVAYDHTGGATERRLTLTGGAWPDWAAEGDVRIGVVSHRAAERLSDAVLTLDPTLNPGGDVAATAYTLYRDTYVLPADFIAQDTPVYEENFGGLTYCHPTDVMWGHRYMRSAGTPSYFTIEGDPRHPLRLAARLFPYPDQARTIDYVYHRRPRGLAISDYREGTVATVAGSTTVTGNGGASFDAAMVGTAFRAGTALAPPTSAIGAAPATFESTVVEVPTSSSLRLSGPAPRTAAALKYVISDPVDLEPGAMLDALLRGVEKHLHLSRRIDGLAAAAAMFDEALRQAKAADSRSFQGRAVGQTRSRHLHPKYMPARFF